LYLDNIMAWKRRELSTRKRRVPMATLQAQVAQAPKPLDFAAALRRAGGPPCLIAEIKRASPSRGLLCHGFDPIVLAKTYADNGASAISVLTDKRFFRGDIEHLRAVRRVVDIPVLRKDFIFDPYQVVEARAAGADALLLIVAVLGHVDLYNLLRETQRLGMTALVEVHNEEDVGQALAAGATVIGVNNRDLRDFSVDLQTTARLRPLIPPEVVLVSESGIHTADDVHRVADMGADAILVGEALMRAEDVAAKVRELAMQ
jgi:indole-3-glycerol phosphate synthase